jgi:hypothetical protein
VAQSPEYGLYGTKTPGEVAEDRRGDARDLEEEKPREEDSVLSDRMRQAGARDSRDSPSIDMER